MEETVLGVVVRFEAYRWMKSLTVPESPSRRCL